MRLGARLVAAVALRLGLGDGHVDARAELAPRAEVVGRVGEAPQAGAPNFRGALRQLHARAAGSRRRRRRALAVVRLPPRDALLPDQKDDDDDDDELEETLHGTFVIDDAANPFAVNSPTTLTRSPTFGSPTIFVFASTATRKSGAIEPPGPRPTVHCVAPIDLTTPVNRAGAIRSGASTSTLRAVSAPPATFASTATSMPGKTSASIIRRNVSRPENEVSGVTLR